MGPTSYVGNFPLTQLYRDGYAVCVSEEKQQSIGEVLFALGTIGIRQRQRDLSLTALSTLSTIDRTGARRLGDLAVSEGVTQPSMSALVSQLERLGLADRQADPRDGRVVRVAITPTGREYLSALRRSGASVFEVLVDKLSPREAASLRSALPVFRRILRLANDDPPSERTAI
jgi:DNA-binding MarR family transcriptional regulator